MTRITCTVTNDLAYDQRMQRICTTLQDAGYEVTLIGRQYPDSPALPDWAFRSIRLRPWFRKGVGFYAEYQIRLFLFLLRYPADWLCAIDLDTLLPVCLAGWARGRKRIFDAHEHFIDMPELIGHPLKRGIWETVARLCIPATILRYSVGPAIARVLSERYGYPFHVIRNAPVTRKPADPSPRDRWRLWYQGALNVGRGLEEIIKALPELPGYSLWLAGEGDLSVPLRELVASLGLEDRVRFLGRLRPEDLPALAGSSGIGLNLLDGSSPNYVLSLANKSLDYLQDGLPALHMDFPEYRQLQNDGPVGVLIPDLGTDTLIRAIRSLEDDRTYEACLEGCRKLAAMYTWETEAGRLIDLYRALESGGRVPE